MEQIFQHNFISVNYLKIGEGSKPIIAFHGFTHDCHIFEDLRPVLPKDSYILAIDLFYHGKTKLLKPIESISKHILKDFFEAFFKHLDINYFSVLGYSMGGRVAIFLMEQFSSKVKDAYLLAPDGIKTSFWTKFVTSTWFGKGMYKLSTKYPGIVFSIAKVGTFIRIFPSSIHKFLQINFGTKQIRTDVYNVWMFYKHIQFKKSDLVSLINNGSINVHIIVGHKDPAIQPKMIKDFSNRIDNNLKVHIVKAGHDLFKPHIYEYLKQEVFN